MIVKIRVKPGSREERVERVDSGYVVYVKSRPEKGKANEDVKRLLAKEFGVSREQINIKNVKSRNKVVEVKE